MQLFRCDDQVTRCRDSEKSPDKLEISTHIEIADINGHFLSFAKYCEGSHLMNRELKGQWSRHSSHCWS